MKRAFRARYGEPPAHLAILLASFALCGYALIRLLSADWWSVVEWVVGAALLHDLVLAPLYGGADRLLSRAVRAGRRDPERRVTLINHVRVPAFLSLLTLLVYWPLISQDAGANYRLATGTSSGVFWQRWLWTTAVFFASSAALLAWRTWRAGRGRGGVEGGEG